MKTSIIVPWSPNDEAIAASAARAAAAGFDGLEIAMARPAGDSSAASVEECRRLRQVVEKAGQAVSAISVEDLAAEDFAISGTGKDRPRWTKVQGVIDSAREMGADGVIVRADVLGAIGVEERHRCLETIHARAMEALWGLRSRAELRAVRISCLSGDGGLSRSPTETRRFLDQINSPWVGLCLDLAGMTVGEANEWIGLLGHRIGRVRLGDAALEEGAPMERVATALGRIRYDGWVTYRGERDWSDAASRLRHGLQSAGGR